MREIMSMAVVVGSALAATASFFGWRSARNEAALAREDADLAYHKLGAAQDAALRLAALEAQLATLRHDIRGILSPAMLVSDRLLEHEDPSVRKAGERVVRTVERAAARLAETKFSSESATLR